MHFQTVGTGNSNLTLNIDLTQTGFVGGTFADPNDPSQFIQPISVHAVPEPLTFLGVVTAAAFGAFFKHKLFLNK